VYRGTGIRFGPVPFAYSSKRGDSYRTSFVTKGWVTGTYRLIIGLDDGSPAHELEFTLGK